MLRERRIKDQNEPDIVENARIARLISKIRYGGLRRGLQSHELRVPEVLQPLLLFTYALCGMPFFQFLFFQGLAVKPFVTVKENIVKDNVLSAFGTIPPHNTLGIDSGQCR